MMRRWQNEHDKDVDDVGVRQEEKLVIRIPLHEDGIAVVMGPQSPVHDKW